MANPMKGEAKLRDYTLTFNFGVAISLEARTGKKMPELMGSIALGLGATELLDFLPEMLKEKHGDKSAGEVRQLVEEFGYLECSTAASKAVAAYFGEKKAKDRNPPQAA